MTVLEKRAADGVDTDSAEVAATPTVSRRSAFRAYLLAGLAAAVIGVGAVVGANGLGLMETDKLSPGSIVEIRAQQLAEDLEGRHWAQLAKVYEQRAEDMVQWHVRQHQARMDWINEQRAQNMVTFKRGWQGGADS